MSEPEKECPKWRVWAKYGQSREDAVEVQAWDAQDAAELWGFDYLLEKREEETLACVLAEGAEKPDVFSVEIEIDVRARPARWSDDPDDDNAPEDK